MVALQQGECFLDGLKMHEKKALCKWGDPLFLDKKRLGSQYASRTL